MTGSDTALDRYRLACLAFIAGFGFLLSFQKVYDYDTWFHLRFGQFIFENFSVPTRDIFSFSTQGAPWVNLYWLSDPLFFLVHKCLGIPGLQILVSAVIALVALFLLLFILRGGMSPFWATFLVVATLEISRFRFLARPLVFKFAGVLFLLWFIYRLQHVRRKEVLLFAVVLLWAGLHPSAFIAQVVMVLLVFEKIVEGLLRSGKIDFAELKTPLLYLLLVSVALLLTPNGFAYYRMVYGHVFTDVVVGIYPVEEHKPLVLRESPAFLGLVAVAVASFWIGRRNFRWISLFLLVAFVYLAFGSMRYVALASLVLAALIGVNLQGCRWPLPSWRIPEVRAHALALVILILGGALTLVTTFRAGKVYEFGPGVNRSRFPYAAVERLRELGFAGNIYNSWAYGGFLLWSLPESKTFIDGRGLPEQLALYQRFLTIELHDFARFMAENQVKAALVERRNERDIEYFNAIPGFRMVHTDDVSVLFLHRDLLGKGQAATPTQYRFLRLGGYEFEYLGPYAKGAEAAAVEQELLQALAMSPGNFFVNFLLAYFYDVRGDQRAAAQYAKAASYNPSFSHTHFQIGIRGGSAALRSRDWTLAEQIVNEALTYQQNAMLYFLLGSALQQQGRLSEAEKAYRRSLSLEDNLQTLNNFGFLLIDAGKLPEAGVVFEKILQAEARSHDEQALYGLTLVAIKTGDQARADKYRELLGERYPNSPFLRRLQP